MPAGGLAFGVLGPLSVRCGPRDGAPTAGKPRTALTLLLLHHGRLVPVPALVDELWEVPPRSARATVHTYVLQLRRELARVTGRPPAEVAAAVLRTVPHGYRLAVPGQLDAEVYRGLRRAGGRALEAGDLAAAAGHFRRALALWRGPAADGVRQGPRIRAEVAALEQSRALLLDYRIELDLRLGRHRQTLGELAALTARDRGHEIRHAQYAVALHRCGHRARALEVLHRLRQDLWQASALEPPPWLAGLHHAVLTADPARDGAEVVPLPRRPTPGLPDIPALSSAF